MIDNQPKLFYKDHLIFTGQLQDATWWATVVPPGNDDPAAEAVRSWHSEITGTSESAVIESAKKHIEKSIQSEASESKSPRK